MLGDAKRLKTRNSCGYLITRKHELRVASQAQAESLARRILEDAANVEQIRAVTESVPTLTPREHDELHARSGDFSYTKGEA